MKKIIPIGVLVVVIIGGLGLWQLTKMSTAKKLPAATTNRQVLPITTNPITNTSQKPGLVITTAAVEDNADPATKKAISDRLQISLQNTSSQTMSSLEIYYEMKDIKTGAIEKYYQKLDGLQIAQGETKTVYFDNESGTGHYPENKYSLYRSSQNEVDFTIEVSAQGYKPTTSTAKKSVGTGETAG